MAEEASFNIPLWLGAEKAQIEALTFAQIL